MRYKLIQSMKSNQDGFTLLETVLILLITAALILLPVLSIDKMMESVQVDLFFRELTSNITLMQNHALLNGERTEIKFRPYKSGHQINFLVNLDASSPLNQTIYLDERFYQIDMKKGYEIKFGSNGNLKQGGHVKFETVEGTYLLKYLQGSGRFGIEEIKDE